MRRDIAAEAGVGFTVIVAAATFAVAAVAGIFLIRESGGASHAQSGGPAQTQSQISLATPDLPRGAQTGRPPEPNSGINPGP